MPTPERTSIAEIVAAAREILELEGLAGLTMAAVAERVGVRAPSLYKRVGSRDELIGLAADATVRELSSRLGALDRGEPRTAIAAMAHGFRAFAREKPAGYHLVFALGPEATRPRTESLTQATEVLTRTIARLVGPDDALEAARLFTAWAHGFVGMELSGAFRMGGDVDRAFDYGIDHLVASLTPMAP
ncbi:TetR family transcriptional regulator [Homoserinimonas aerilata]|uniref:TetR family transcriptional regulator n=1 Tax=Homoserinimonas aerilata TaxID=1162970 RepID=A0A542YG07_9MICO|nr:TetR/AcrR family transcriptional regulator [Homoserinimonas aerilata]TQL47017.1 TetR family transcriptional regulator [Homoserinimonas aerilata]